MRCVTADAEECGEGWERGGGGGRGAPGGGGGGGGKGGTFKDLNPACSLLRLRTRRGPCLQRVCVESSRSHTIEHMAESTIFRALDRKLHLVVSMPS